MVEEGWERAGRGLGKDELEKDGLEKGWRRVGCGLEKDGLERRHPQAMQFAKT
jgi:hypothetical protein